MLLDLLRSDPTAQSVLEARARDLARSDTAGKAESGTPTLTFTLGGGSYSLPAVAVREVMPLPPVAPLPATPPFIVGLTNVRGQLVAAIDPRPLLEIPAAPPVPGCLLLVIKAGDITAGLLADSVVAVRHLADTLTPTPAANAGRGQLWVRGVDSSLSLHLDVDLLLADLRLAINAEAVE
ncbi:chemotaxis protein CheW [Chloroflexales bacterium ZM16-3]|nr:chemotaxis protein CheW [Chloroflexales bacterium ZM16-3]